VPLRVNQADVARLASSRLLSRAMLHQDFFTRWTASSLTPPSRALDKKSYVGAGYLRLQRKILFIVC